MSRVEEALAEAWQLHRSEARARPPLPPPQQQSPLQQPPAFQQLQGLYSQALVGSPSYSSPSGRHFNLEAGHGGASHPLTTSLSSPGTPCVDAAGSGSQDRARSGSEVASPGRVDGGAHAVGLGARDGVQMIDSTKGAVGGGGKVLVVGPPEYLQWLGDMSNMLVHEQWRKEVGLC